MKGYHRLPVFRIHIEAGIAGNVFVISYFAHACVAVEKDQADEVFKAGAVVFVLRDAVFVREDGAPDELLGVVERDDVGEMRDDLVLAFPGE